MAFAIVITGTSSDTPIADVRVQAGVRLESRRLELPTALAGYRDERWVDGWRPRYLPPGNGRTEAGTVFTAGTGAELTIWCLTEFDADESLVRYARVTPASRAGTVEVRCRPAPGGGSDVQVSYRLAALGDAGVEDLRAYEAEAFARMIDGWKQRIEARLPGLLATPIP